MKCHLDYDQFTAGNIYFTLGLAQGYNVLSGDICRVLRAIVRDVSV